jgi:hypothetical protein
MKPQLGASRRVAALLAWVPLWQSAPGDLAAWDWEAAHAIGGITDALSAVHLQQDGTLIGLDDDGWVISVSSLVQAAPSSGWPRSRLAGGGDLEGLCAARPSGLLVLLEDRCEIVRLDRHGERVGRHRLCAEIPRGGQGLEGLARVPAADGADTLWLGHQGTRKVYVVRAPSGREDPGPLALLRILDLGDEARGMVFDPRLGAVLAVMDEAREVWLIDQDGAIRDRRPWPKGTRDVEGITHGPFGSLLLALDGGGVWRIPPRQSRARGALRHGQPAEEQNVQGGRKPASLWPLTLRADGLAGQIEGALLRLRVTERGETRAAETRLILTPGARVLGAALCSSAPRGTPASPTWILALIEAGPAGRALSLHDVHLPRSPEPVEVRRRGLILLDEGTRPATGGKQAEAQADLRAPLLLWPCEDGRALCALSPPDTNRVILVEIPRDAEPRMIGAIELAFTCSALERRATRPAELIALGLKQRRVLEIRAPDERENESEHEGDRQGAGDVRARTAGPLGVPIPTLEAPGVAGQDVPRAPQVVPGPADDPGSLGEHSRAVRETRTETEQGAAHTAHAVRQGQGLYLGVAHEDQAEFGGGQTAH